MCSHHKTDKNCPPHQLRWNGSDTFHKYVPCVTDFIDITSIYDYNPVVTVAVLNYVDDVSVDGYLQCGCWSCCFII